MAVPDMSNVTFDGDRPACENQEVELVEWHNRCEKCDEQRIDWLVWVSIEGDTVECQTCKATYTP